MNHRAGWQKAAFRRRTLLFFLVVVPAAAAALEMRAILPDRSGVVLNAIMVLLFAMLSAWVAVGFWTAAAGIVSTCKRFDRFYPVPADDGPIRLPDSVRTAILFPVYNEEPRRVVEAVRIVRRSLEKLGVRRNFDIFMLSDSTDPDSWIGEEEAWREMCGGEHAVSGVYYRHRKVNRKGKSGNVADFCRRWGANYSYMIVFDADSMMSGRTLARLVGAMEANPDIGILQTAPKAVNARSLIARMQAFSSHLYGPVFAAGLHYWLLGDAQYWGHNAVIRLEPFMRHCHLPVIPGRAPLGGNILSHDFVEAALMRRAGYGVWLAHGLEGSYEENPPSLIDELVRDRRWCQGNLQHGRLLFTPGFHPAHRALFVNGIMSYASALLWFLFLLIGSCQAVLELLIAPVYFPEGYSLIPDWPKFLSVRALELLGSALVLLFLPKFATLVMTMVRGAGGFGGNAKMAASAAAELFFSALLAPVRMLYHSCFVVTTLAGFTIRWNAQNRDSDGVGWGRAFRFHWWCALLGLFWGFLIHRLNPGYFLWLAPVLAGMVLSIPLSVWTSRASVGDRLNRFGLFLTPADVNPPEEVAALDAAASNRADADAFPILPGQGFIRAVVVPRLFMLHLSFLRKITRRFGERNGELPKIVAKALSEGPDSLSRKERNLLLSDPAGFTELHRRVWLLQGEEARRWGLN